MPHDRPAGRSGLHAPLNAPCPSDVKVDVIDVGRPMTKNLAVEDIRAEETDLHDGKPVDNGKALVRNIDPTESDIERTTANHLREVYRLPQSKESGARADRPPETLAAGSERPDELWRSVAWVLLIVLVADTFVANRSYA